MEEQIFIFLILFAQIGKGFREVEYCCVPCERGVHTVCLYPKKGIGKDCVNYTSGTITSSERLTLLKRHNELRQKTANGETNGMPAGANILEMIWDYELEFIAKRWNDQCNFGHDKCRNSLRFSVGQNIATSYDDRAESMIDLWFEEYNFTPVHLIDNLTETYVKVPVNGKSEEKAVGHFTQLVWAKTYRLGCSVMTQHGAGKLKKTLMCNYGPSGNVMTTEIYKKGPGCSQCPEGTRCSTTYPGLCALRCSILDSSFCSGAVISASLPKKLILLLIIVILSISKTTMKYL